MPDLEQTPVTHRPVPLRDQLITGAKLFGIISAVMLAIWLIDGTVSR